MDEQAALRGSHEGCSGRSPRNRYAYDEDAPVEVKMLSSPVSAKERIEGHYTDPTGDGNSFRSKLNVVDPPEHAEEDGEWRGFEDRVCWCETINVPWLSYDVQLGPGLKPVGGHMEVLISRYQH